MKTIRYRGYQIDPIAGVAIGRRGKPISKINSGGGEP